MMSSYSLQGNLKIAIHHSNIHQITVMSWVRLTYRCHMEVLHLYIHICNYEHIGSIKHTYRMYDLDSMILLPALNLLGSTSCLNESNGMWW